MTNNDKQVDYQACGFNVKDFGAKGDGSNDDTQSIQQAINHASEAGGGGVWFPPGVYMSSTLKVPSYVGLFGLPTWSYHHNGGTIIKLNDEKATSLIDLTGSYGARVSGLGLEGCRLGEGVCGIFLDGSNHKQEDTVFIDNCRISLFTGHGIWFEHIWGFTVRDCMIIFNDGDGINFSHWDGWIHDNIFNNNKGFGINAKPWNGALTVVDNRIEWNYKGGIYVGCGGHYSINNNYFDRSGGPAILIDGGTPEDVKHGRKGAHTITGNVIKRSGAKAELDSHDNCHVRLDYQQGVVLTSNVMTTGRNDSGQGQLSPTYGIIYGGMRETIIKDNVMHNGSTKELMVDLGDNERCIVKDNIGSVDQSKQ